MRSERGELKRPIKLYHKSGYLNMPEIIETGYPFIFIPAARGTGKTYGTLKYFIEKRKPIMLIRRTKTEADLQRRPESSSYIPVFLDLGIDKYYFGKSGSLSVLKYEDPDSGDEQTAAIFASLSTFSSVRGADFSSIEYLVFDEFIAEPHVKKIKAEGMAFANLYETINRNRELSGRRPLQAILLANSVNMANDIFLYFNMIREAENMITSGTEQKAIGNKLLIIPVHSPISKKKSGTALYKAVTEEYAEMAISNKFILNDFTYVKKRILKEYSCSLNVGSLYVWQHKSESKYYVTKTKGKTKTMYKDGYADLEKMRRAKFRFVSYYLDGLIYFDSYESVALWEKYFNL